MLHITARTWLAASLIAGALVSAGRIRLAAASGVLPALSGKPLTQFSLKPPPHHHSKALGVGEVLREGSTYSMAVVAHGVKPAGADAGHGLWIVRYHRAPVLLGFAAPVPGHPRRLRAVKRLPGSRWESGKLLITLETRAHPARPGRVILRGFYCVLCSY